MALKQRSDGYYCAWYAGKQFLGKTEAEALDRRDRYKLECEYGIEKPARKTVFDFAEEWLPAAKAGVARRTYNQYATILEHLTDVAGKKQLSAVSPLDIQKVWATMAGKSQSYISKANFLYTAFFRAAMDNKFCRINPMLADSAKPERGRSGSHRALTETEIGLIETVPHRVQNAALLMLKAGLRRGEVLALRGEDIHDNRIYVLNAVKFASNRPVVGWTKNESSERSVPLFASLRALNGITGLILPDEHGNICSETAFARAWESYLSALSAHLNGVQKRWYHLTREWKESHPDEYQKYLDLKKKDPAKAEEYRLRGWQEVSFRPHDLRHTFVTYCRDRGVDIKVCMAWCGHSSERMILKIYDHPSKSREDTAISMMDA